MIGDDAGSAFLRDHTIPLTGEKGGKAWLVKEKGRGSRGKKLNNTKRGGREKARLHAHYVSVQCRAEDHQKHKA